MSYHPTFIIDENILTIYPSRPQIEKWLTYKEKMLAPGGEVVKEDKAIFWVKEYRPEGNVISTWQGLWKRLWTQCVQKGWEPVIHDVRDPFPPPKLHLMHGFRHEQKRLTTELLEQGWSGIMDAVTRFGKTHCIANVIRAYPDLKTVVIVPGKDLGRQLYDDLVELLEYRDVKLLGFGSKNRTQGDDVTVCSMDSLDKLDHTGTRLVLADEIHMLVTDSRLPKFSRFLKARKLGFGATSAGRFDNRDILIEGAIGPILTSIGYREAVAKGAICPITVFMLRAPYSVEHLPRQRNDIYDRILWQNQDRLNLLGRVCQEVIPQDWQTLMFIANEPSALKVVETLGEDTVIAMAKRMTDKERKAKMHQMRRGEIFRCAATKIYSQGVTFPDVRVAINWMGGGANTFVVQMVGRVAQLRPEINKKCGVVIDLLFEGFGRAQGKSWGPTAESAARLKLYQEKGYDVVICNTLAELKREWAARV